MSEAVGDLLRRAYPRVLARTMSLTRSLPDAEDAVQEAIVRALESWPERGYPDAPEAWLVTVARNVYRDRARRAAREDLHGEPLEVLSQMSPWVRIAVAEPEVVPEWKDELLRVLFACCHPALECGESAALALSAVIGLSTSEIAAAFVVAPRSMEQRLTRARRRLRERGDVEGAPPAASLDRLDAVMQAIALLFNEGYWSSDDATPIRAELCRLAIGLGHSLLAAFPGEPEVAGLLALMKLHDARRDARFSATGSPVPLPDQDRSRWDHESIASATALLERALAVGKHGAFQIEAAISSIHCHAPSAASTDWREIAELYAALERYRPTPAVRVNRAFAVARSEGAHRGLALLDEGVDVRGYPYLNLVRGALLEELGRFDEARAAFVTAQHHARNAAERAQIGQRMAKLDERAGR